MYSIDNAYAGYHDRLHRVYNADMKAKDATRGMMRVNGGEYYMARRIDYATRQTYIEVVVLDNDGNPYTAREYGSSFRLGGIAYEKALQTMSDGYKQQQADELLAIALAV